MHGWNKGIMISGVPKSVLSQALMKILSLSVKSDGYKTKDDGIG